MSSAPLLRPPIPGSNGQSGSRAPKLGLSIPPSPNAKPADSGAKPTELAPNPRPVPPTLRLATPLGTNSTPAEERRGRLPPLQLSTGPGLLSNANAGQPVSGSSVEGGLNGSSANSIASLLGPQNGDPLSSISSGYSTGEEGGKGDRDGSLGLLPDLEKLSISKGRPLDVEDLDDNGWRAASKENKIKELGSLGEGAGGAVTKCILEGAKTVFALKIITTDPNPDVKKQIVRELNFNKSCASDHICRYYGAFMDDSSGTISIAMEYCEGGSLDAVYREVKKQGGRTGEKVLGKVAEGVLNGLTYLHGRKIIHRDIKPSNILLCRDGQVKLIDFGVSGEFGTKGDANTFIGTSYYMAPERITGQSYTITSESDGSEMQPRAGLIDMISYIVGPATPKLRDEPEKNVKWSENFKYFIECCLEKETSRRATPWRMMEHPWMQDISKRKVDMSKFLRQVWAWKE